MSPFPLNKTASEWCKENIGDNEMKYYYVVVTWSHAKIPNQIVKGNIMTLLLDKHPLLYLKELDDDDYFEKNKEEWDMTFFCEVPEEVFNLCKDYHS